MLIPVRCFSCGKVLATKYEKFKKLEKEKYEKEKYLHNQDENVDLQDIFCKLKLKRYCCRRMILTHVNLLEIIKEEKQ
jgi:DNA-directed RNA polymerase I, II, and III subunit RPABC5